MEKGLGVEVKMLMSSTMEDDNEPIGIVLVADKNDVVVKYALGGISNNLFVSKYQFYLPDKKLLQEKVKEVLEE